jgi:hypothetical protein
MHNGHAALPFSLSPLSLIEYISKR